VRVWARTPSELVQLQGTMDIAVQESDEVQSSEDIVQRSQIPQRSLHGFADVNNHEGSQDDLYFDDYMAQQEHGARSRYRQSMVHLHYNTTEELDHVGRYGGVSTREQRWTRRTGLEVGRRQSLTTSPFERYRGEAARSSRFEEQSQSYGMDPAPNSQPQVVLAQERGTNQHNQPQVVLAEERGTNQQPCDAHTSKPPLRKNGNWTDAAL
jgi:hypothetical protein